MGNPIPHPMVDGVYAQNIVYQHMMEEEILSDLKIYQILKPIMIRILSLIVKCCNGERRL